MRLPEPKEVEMIPCKYKGDSVINSDGTKEDKNYLFWI